MEEYFKFALYAFLFVIYLVAQVRKARKKAEEERALQPEPVKQVVVKQAPSAQKTFDYKGKRELKAEERKSIFTPKEQPQHTVDYKPVADEELIAEAVLKDRKKQRKAMKEARKPLTEEHLAPYVPQTKESKINMEWLKDKSAMKRAFIATEIFQRKY